MQKMKDLKTRNVYHIHPRWEATQKDARVLGDRSVDTLKGLRVRSRLVCQDFNTPRRKRDEMTPPHSETDSMDSEAMCASRSQERCSKDPHDVGLQQSVLLW